MEIGHGQLLPNARQSRNPAKNQPDAAENAAGRLKLFRPFARISISLIAEAGSLERAAARTKTYAALSICQLAA
jgi:hypothetical protein